MMSVLVSGEFFKSPLSGYDVCLHVSMSPLSLQTLLRKHFLRSGPFAECSGVHAYRRKEFAEKLEVIAEPERKRRLTVGIVMAVS